MTVDPIERHSDQCDIAADNEDRFRAEAIRVAAQAVRVPLEFNGTDCTECELPIPQARLELGKFTCVDCQTFLEQQKKFFRKG